MRDLLNPAVSTLDAPSGAAIGRTAAITALGFALYGLTVGFWRSPQMGVYVAIKMPMLIACTLGFNGLLNGLLGLLLGSGLGFRQSLHALLSAFAISALILGSIAPVTFFLALNAPAPDSPDAVSAHAAYLLAHTTLIGIAGLIGVIRLGQLLENYCASRSIARSTLAAWIGGNAFLGMQFSWIFRPFFGSPQLDVAFFRENAMRGSFYEAVWSSLRHIAPDLPGASAIAIIVLLSCSLILINQIRRKRTNPQPTRP